MDQMQTRMAPGTREQYGWWRGVQVTDATMTVDGRTYQVGQLRWLRVQPGRPRPVRRVVLGVAVTLAAVVALALAGFVETNGVTAAVYAVAVGQGLMTVGLVGFALARWRRPMELWAAYRGEPTMLYRNADRYEFGKVQRAVQRAMVTHRLLK
jgi:hypothetical protein